MKHGGDLTEAMARHGGAREAWLDLSTGINPSPWPIPSHLPDHVWQRLPSQADQKALLDAARENYRVPENVDVVAGSGTQALIQWIPYLAAPGPVAIVGPTYSEHANAWRSAGHEVVEISDIERLASDVRHVVIVNPNNPDGRIVDLTTLAHLAGRLQQRGGWLVIDEAFADVDPAISAASICEHLPIVTLRSFGKFYGLAGLRLGFAIGQAPIAQRIAAALGPWSCSGPALHIGTLALRDRDWADRTRQALKERADKLDELLAKAGLELAGGTTLFRLARHADAIRLHALLAQQHIWCRRFAHADDLLRFGLPQDSAALDRLAKALASAF